MRLHVINGKFLEQPSSGKKSIKIVKSQSPPHTTFLPQIKPDKVKKQKHPFFIQGISEFISQPVKHDSGTNDDSDLDRLSRILDNFPSLKVQETKIAETDWLDLNHYKTPKSLSALSIDRELTRNKRVRVHTQVQKQENPIRLRRAVQRKSRHMELAKLNKSGVYLLNKQQGLRDRRYKIRQHLKNIQIEQQQRQEHEKILYRQREKFKYRGYADISLLVNQDL